MIPRLLHFVWIGGPLPEWAERHVAEWRRLNPEFEVRIHGEDALLPAYRQRYDECRNNPERSDLIRYSVLESDGGWYADLDFWPFRPLAEAESAWGLDGGKLAVARQHGNHNPELAVANSPLACQPGSPALAWIRQAVLAGGVAGHRGEYGPRLMVALKAERPDLVAVMDWPWWFPSAIATAPTDYGAILAGDSHWARNMCPQTGGQLPMAMHLWLGGQTELRPAPIRDSRPIALICHSVHGPERKQANPGGSWPLGHAIPACAAGLEEAGYRVVWKHATEMGDWPRLIPNDGFPAVAVIWNGRHEIEREALAHLEEAAVPVWHLEHGFWRRREYVQVDRAGFLHNASWAHQWGAPPHRAAELLAEQWSEAVLPVLARSSGRVLVIGQIGGDTQLEGAEIVGPAPLERLVSTALPAGIEAVFRPHPHGIKVERETYLPHESGSLAEALAGCRFVVTINSNTIVEATAAGVPCLAFGPSTAINAGVARRTTVATLAADLKAMLAGWQPPAGAGENYLRWLACRQYRVSDLRTAAFWKAREVVHA